MSKVHGYIEINADDLIEYCELYFKDRSEREEKAKEDAIEYEMNKKLFPASTKEQALERTLDIFGYSWKLKGSRWAGEIKSILNQAKTAKKNKGYVFISNDIHYILEDFIK